MCYVLANAIGVMYYVYILICFVVVPILASSLSSSYTTKFTWYMYVALLLSISVFLFVCCFCAAHVIHIQLVILGMTWKREVCALSNILVCWSRVGLSISMSGWLGHRCECLPACLSNMCPCDCLCVRVSVCVLFGKCLTAF